MKKRGQRKAARIILRLNTATERAKAIRSVIPQDPLARVALIREGIKKRQVLQLREAMNVGSAEFAQLLNVDQKTISLKTQSDRFNPRVTERALEMARVYELGLSVFNDQDKFYSWLQKPLSQFQGKTPYSFLDTNEGAELVENALLRIEHGVY